MGTNDVRIDQKLNKAIWSQGVKYVIINSLSILQIDAY